MAGGSRHSKLNTNGSLLYPDAAVECSLLPDPGSICRPNRSWSCCIDSLSRNSAAWTKPLPASAPICSRATKRCVVIVPLQLCVPPLAAEYQRIAAVCKPLVWHCYRSASACILCYRSEAVVVEIIACTGIRASDKTTRLQRNYVVVEEIEG